MYKKRGFKLNNKKGFTLIELVITVAVLGLVFVLITEVFLNVFITLKTTNDYLDQQRIVNLAVEYIGRDIAECSAYKVDDAKKVLILDFTDSTGKPRRYWKFSDGALLLSEDENFDPAKTDKMVENIDIAKSKFIYDPVKKHVNLQVKPINKEHVRFQNRNITKPIVVEYSVKYKKQI